MYKKTIPTKFFIEYFLRLCADIYLYRNGKNPEVSGKRAGRLLLLSVSLPQKNG